MVEQVKLPPEVVSVRVLAALLLLQCPANVLGKAVIDGPVHVGLCTHVGDLEEAPGSLWLLWE